jgi:hypothetical protein
MTEKESDRFFGREAEIAEPGVAEQKFRRFENTRQRLGPKTGLKTAYFPAAQAFDFASLPQK